MQPHESEASQKRIVALIRALKVRLSNFASPLYGVSEDTVNSLISNKPDNTFDSIFWRVSSQILIAYPQVREEWLMKGDGDMFEEQVNIKPTATNPQEAERIKMEIVSIGQRIWKIERYLERDLDPLMVKIESQNARIKAQENTTKDLMQGNVLQLLKEHEDLVKEARRFQGQIEEQDETMQDVMKENAYMRKQLDDLVDFKKQAEQHLQKLERKIERLEGKGK